jgi:hypothetical protein
MDSEMLSRRLLALVTLLLPLAITLALVSPTDSDGYVTGPSGRLANVLGFVSVFGSVIAAIWHALVMRPWRPGIPRWVVIILVLLGNVVGAILYYFLVAHRYRRPSEPVSGVGAA